MTISHDGDRVSSTSNNDTYQKYSNIYDDDLLNKLIHDLASEDPEKVLHAQLYYQPGSYGCSTPEIDQMVDIVSGIGGVAGAQIAGAGLGGCIMILTQKEAVALIKETLEKHYYLSQKKEPAVYPCVTVEGAGIIEF
jgi:N-acetylgalactosamine kinase